MKHEREKSHEGTALERDCRQLINIENSRNRLLLGRASQLVIQCQVVRLHLIYLQVTLYRLNRLGYVFWTHTKQHLKKKRPWVERYPGKHICHVPILPFLQKLKKGLFKKYFNYLTGVALANQGKHRDAHESLLFYLISVQLINPVVLPTTTYYLLGTFYFWVFSFKGCFWPLPQLYWVYSTVQAVSMRVGTCWGCSYTEHGHTLQFSRFQTDTKDSY